MTTLTGITEQKHAGTVDHTSFELAIFGAVLQLSTVLGVWASQTSASVCLGDPIACLSNLSSADPWGRQVLLTLCFAGTMWLLSIYRGSESGTSDPSIVDRLWSINPLVYTLHFWYSAGGLYGTNMRLHVMGVLVAAWSTRLTWNFWRKGGFSGGEDYRWIEVRKWFPGWKFEVFNLLFICFFQQCAILAFSTPAAYAYQSQVPWNNIDTAASVLYVALVIGETVADNQVCATNLSIVYWSFGFVVWSKTIVIICRCSIFRPRSTAALRQARRWVQAMNEASSKPVSGVGAVTQITSVK